MNFDEASIFFEIKTFVQLGTIKVQVKKFKKHKFLDPEVHLCLLVSLSSLKKLICKDRLGVLKFVLLKFSYLYPLSDWPEVIGVFLLEKYFLEKNQQHTGCLIANLAK